MVLTSVFAAVVGVVGTAGEFRHHTAGTTYLLTPARGRVLLAKLVVGAPVGTGRPPPRRYGDARPEPWIGVPRRRRRP